MSSCFVFCRWVCLLACFSCWHSFADDAAIGSLTATDVGFVYDGKPAITANDVVIFGVLKKHATKTRVEIKLDSDGERFPVLLSTLNNQTIRDDSTAWYMTGLGTSAQKQGTLSIVVELEKGFFQFDIPVITGESAKAKEEDVKDKFLGRDIEICFVSPESYAKETEKLIDASDLNFRSPLISYLVGAVSYEEKFKLYNTKGPNGAYSDCYAALLDALSLGLDNPIGLEALRLLAVAKLYSSDYVEGRKLLKLLESNLVSEGYRKFAIGALSELDRLIEKRERVSDAKSESKHPE